MIELIKQIIEGKEWIFSGIGIFILGWLWKGRKKGGNGGKDRPFIIKINNSTNNSSNNTNNNTNNNHSNRKNPGGQQKKKGNWQKKSGKLTKNAVRLMKIRPYITGINGKTYNVSTFHRQLNHNMGAEVSVQNSGDKSLKFLVRCRITDSAGKNIYDKTQVRKAAPNQTTSTDIYVPDKVFSNLFPGKYKAAYWVDGKNEREFPFSVAIQ